MEEEELSSSSYSYSDDFSQSEEPLPVKVYTKDYKLHEFPFSTVDRALPDVPLPRDYKLTDEQFWTNGRPNVDNIKEHLAFEGTKPFVYPRFNTDREAQERAHNVAH